MPHKISAGLLMYRFRGSELEVFLGHPGGPFCQNRDRDCWSIPKGENERNESLIQTAVREFREEVGLEPCGPYFDMGWIRQKSGKKVYAWAFKGDCDESKPLKSNLFELEWPPRSGRRQWYPEVDRAVFFTLNQARVKLKEAQHLFLDRLEAYLKEATSSVKAFDASDLLSVK